MTEYLKRLRYRLFCWWHGYCSIHNVKLVDVWIPLTPTRPFCEQCELERSAALQRQKALIEEQEKQLRP